MGSNRLIDTLRRTYLEICTGHVMRSALIEDEFEQEDEDEDEDE